MAVLVEALVAVWAAPLSTGVAGRAFLRCLPRPLPGPANSPVLRQTRKFLLRNTWTIRLGVSVHLSPLRGQLYSRLSQPRLDAASTGFPILFFVVIAIGQSLPLWGWLPTLVREIDGEPSRASPGELSDVPLRFLEAAYQFTPGGALVQLAPLGIRPFHPALAGGASATSLRGY